MTFPCCPIDWPCDAHRKPEPHATQDQLTKGHPAMSAEPAYDPSNVHLAQGQTVATAQFLAAADTSPEAAGPDAPILCTLTPKAETYLDAELSPAEPEPEAGL